MGSTGCTLGGVCWVRLRAREWVWDWATALSNEQKKLMASPGRLPYLPRP